MNLIMTCHAVIKVKPLRRVLNIDNAFLKFHEMRKITLDGSKYFEKYEFFCLCRTKINCRSGNDKMRDKLLKWNDK